MSKAVYEGEELGMTFIDYKIFRNSEGQIQFDEELLLQNLNANWKEGDNLVLSVVDNMITLTKQ